ncbi:MAG: hypothetical protein ACFFBS_09435 [Promethearchaeota archaeon]
MNYIGVDLGASAVSKKASSAVAILGDSGCLINEPKHFNTAAELVQLLSQFNPQSIILAVDAPRSVPDNTTENYAYRSCEKEIKTVDKGAGSFYGAAALYIRWYEIETGYLQNVKVIETYPRVVWKILGLPETPKYYRKNREAVWSSVGELVMGTCKGFSPHQIDAILCAYTAFCYGNQRIHWFGKPGEGLVITPPIGEPRPLSIDAEHITDPCRCFRTMYQLTKRFQERRRVNHLLDRSPTMIKDKKIPQNRESGARANKYGREYAKIIAAKIGAKSISETSNEFVLQGRKITIRCARHSTNNLGVTYSMLERVDVIYAALEQENGKYDLYEIKPSIFKRNMRETRSRGRSAGKVGLVRKSVFVSKGNFVCSVKM